MDDHTMLHQEKVISLDAKDESPPFGEEVKKKVNQMTLDEKIGQLIIGGIGGATITEGTKELVNTYKIGNFVLFKQNLTNVQQSMDFMNGLKAANKGSDIPLLLSVDQEGGTTTRLPDIHE